MMKIFLDTNFILDYFVRPEFMPDADKLLVSGRLAGNEFYISYLSVANFAYIIRKAEADNKRRVALIETCCELFEVVSNHKKQIEKAVALNAKDFEDALQYFSALDAKCDCIITRNTKDFQFSKIPVYTPSEFLKKLK